MFHNLKVIQEAQPSLKNRATLVVFRIVCCENEDNLHFTSPEGSGDGHRTSGITYRRAIPFDVLSEEDSLEISNSYLVWEN